MLWGTSITEMTGMISRRSALLLAATPPGPRRSSRSTTRQETSRSSVLSTRSREGRHGHGVHICGAPLDLERGENRENYAYSFIHGAYPTKEMNDMKFDVIVGNPPYQIDSDGRRRAPCPSTSCSSNRPSHSNPGTS